MDGPLGDIPKPSKALPKASSGQQTPPPAPPKPLLPRGRYVPMPAPPDSHKSKTPGKPPRHPGPPHIYKMITQRGRGDTRKVFYPPKYYRGLSKTKKAKRLSEIKKFGSIDWRDPRAYRGFQTNRGVKTRKSSYTAEWDRFFPTTKSLKDRAALTGVPEDLLEESYNRGMAAWRTGHRPGATQQQWGYARVSSMLLLGKTAYTTDADLVREAKRRSEKARKWYKKIAKRSTVQFM